MKVESIERARISNAELLKERSLIPRPQFPEFFERVIRSL
jgi:hypothetical protein